MARVSPACAGVVMIDPISIARQSIASRIYGLMVMDMVLYQDLQFRPQSSGKKIQQALRRPNAVALVPGMGIVGPFVAEQPIVISNPRQNDVAKALFQGLAQTVVNLLAGTVPGNQPPRSTIAFGSRIGETHGFFPRRGWMHTGRKP